jgi:hypothetical protein
MEGYDSLTAYTGTHPSLQIYRSFSILNQRSLALFQAEISEKERQLIIAIENDRKSGDPERQKYSINFRKLLESTPAPNDDKPNQKTIALELRSLLKEYSM